MPKDPTKVVNLAETTAKAVVAPELCTAEEFQQLLDYVEERIKHTPNESMREYRDRLVMIRDRFYPPKDRYSRPDPV